VGLLGRLLGLTTTKLTNSLENPTRSLAGASTWDDVFDGASTLAGVRVSQKRALGYPPLLRGVTKITNDVGKLRLHVRERTPDGGAEKARRHPAWPILARKANRFITSGRFKKALQFHALWHGNGYAAISRLNNGDVAPASMPGGGLAILDPAETFPVQANGELWYVTSIKRRDSRGRVADTTEVKIPAEDIIHIRGLSSDGISGVDIFDLIREALGIPLAAREYEARFFGQGGNQSGVLMIPGRIRKDRQEKLLAAWAKMTTGLTKAHKIALIQEGAKFVPTSTDPEKAALIGAQELEIKMVANILGLPPHMLGDSSRTAYNSIEAENRNYLESCLDAWLCDWEEETADKLLRESEIERDSHFIEFNRAQLLMMDFKGRAESYRVYREIGAMGVNDVARAEGWPTIGPPGDVRHVPSNWIPLTEAGKTTATSARVHRELIVDRLQRLAEIEATEMKRLTGSAEAARRAGEWFENHRGRVESSLTLPVRAALVAGGSRDDGAADIVGRFARSYVASRIAGEPWRNPETFFATEAAAIDAAADALLNGKAKA
jgi:HK97 family phage portal protein